ncbi:replication factor RFC1 C terminal domain-containing protein [Zychaea mexicana]|uniref:replication factor RFC1 C terminal domain-containing protein n=1 Tax=Zychaea mexicana TaxID=64656 RepID=UPI0022FDEF1D|nr:replication factor RFC1 C terminal domain-containing protein [Zychaea mexicana]KAI9477089.1 replication factor RFC1 C terminal domain-containing protein [Zychaea mexicana]
MDLDDDDFQQPLGAGKSLKRKAEDAGSNKNKKIRAIDPKDYFATVKISRGNNSSKKKPQSILQDTDDMEIIKGKKSTAAPAVSPIPQEQKPPKPVEKERKQQQQTKPSTTTLNLSAASLSGSKIAADASSSTATKDSSNDTTSKSKQTAAPARTLSSITVTESKTPNEKSTKQADQDIMSAFKMGQRSSGSAGAAASSSSSKATSSGALRQINTTPVKAEGSKQGPGTGTPQALGSRPLPIGKDGCFTGSVFVFSGTLDSMTSDTAHEIVERYGGNVTTEMNFSTTYLVQGRGSDPAAVKKADKYGTIVVDEDGFYKLVTRSLPSKSQKLTSASTSTVSSSASLKGKGKAIAALVDKREPIPVEQLWTEKYRPKKISEIVGNKEVVKQIDQWLKDWHRNLNANNNSNIKSGGSSGKKSNGSPSNFRSVLISGPPGVGKSTTAHVVAIENGYEVLEFNASDVRSKKALEDILGEMVDNRTMTEFYKRGAPSPVSVKGKKVVLVMDEVDGMTSGDRGGAVELAGMIKNTKIPIICICNDIRSPKVAPLKNVCFDARFKRTPVNQIRSKIMSIAYKENLFIKPAAVDELVQATHNDIRQVINILSTYRLASKKMSDEDAKAVAKANEKDSTMNLFDIPDALFSTPSWYNHTLAQKLDIYFYDYGLTPLMVFENYLKFRPDKPNKLCKTGRPAELAALEMKMAAQAAEAMADGDLVNSMIHGSVQQFSLMPVESALGCVRPAGFMHGTSSGFNFNFPGWLGQNSKAGKFDRMVNEMRSNMRFNATADRNQIRQHYVPTLNDRIFKSLAEERYDDAMAILDTYYLNRNSLESLNELDLSPQKPMSKLPTKAKSAFTRKYNKASHPMLRRPKENNDIVRRKGTSASNMPTEDSEGEDERDYGADVSEEEDVDF